MRKETDGQTDRQAGDKARQTGKRSDFCLFSMRDNWE